MPKRTAKSPKAFSYVRFSRPEQIKGDSLRRQQELSTEWCKRNSVQLDNSLRLEDHGVSAFHGRNAAVGKLRAFLEFVERGVVKKGDYLIVESLDRITREHVQDAIERFLGILRHGVNIVTLSPTEHVYKSGNVDMTDLIVAVVTMGRAHEESAIKGKRVAEAWRKKREALEPGVPITKRVPSWIAVTEQGFELLPDRVEVVRRIIRMYFGGFGDGAIAKKLNQEEIPPFLHGKHWHVSTIKKILTSRSLIGEFQPHFGRSYESDRKRKPAGEPIVGYYPNVIKESEFYRLQDLRKSRRGKTRGRAASNSTPNLFAGLLFDVRDGSSMIVVDKGIKGGGKQYVSSAAKVGAGTSSYLAIPFDITEFSLLDVLREIRPDDVLPPKPSKIHEEDLIEECKGRIRDLNERIDAIKKRFRTEVAFEALLNLMEELEVEKNKELQNLESLKLVEHRDSPTQAISDAKDVIQLLASAEDSELNDYRSRLASIIRNLVESVQIFPCRCGKWLFVLVEVHFLSGGLRNVAFYKHSSGIWGGGHWQTNTEILVNKKNQVRLKNEVNEKPRSIAMAEARYQGLILGLCLNKMGSISIDEVEKIYKIGSAPIMHTMGRLAEFAQSIS